MNQALILYNNLMRVIGNTTTYTGTEVEGFEVENTYDWRDFSLFRAEAATRNVDTVVLASTSFDTAAIWTAGRGITGTIILQVETGPATATFTTIYTFTLLASGDTMAMAAFTEVTALAGARVRWRIEAGASRLDIKQLCVGIGIENPIGQYVGQNPPNLFHGVVTTNVIAVNGSIIGRNYRRLERKTEISWQHLQPSWVRTYWQPFAKHCARNSFFYQWSPANYPLEVVMAAAEDIIPPVNASPPPLMSVSMPLRCLVALEVDVLPPDPPTPPEVICDCSDAILEIYDPLSAPATELEVI